MTDEGVLNSVEKRKYRHRLAMNGEPLFYYAFVARKATAIPREWLDENMSTGEPDGEIFTSARLA